MLQTMWDVYFEVILSFTDQFFFQPVAGALTRLLFYPLVKDFLSINWFSEPGVPAGPRQTIMDHVQVKKKKFLELDIQMIFTFHLTSISNQNTETNM